MAHTGLKQKTSSMMSLCINQDKPSLKFLPLVTMTNGKNWNNHRISHNDGTEVTLQVLSVGWLSAEVD